MAKSVLDQIDREIAQLQRLVPTPTGDLGFGSDLSCVSDLTEDAAEVDGHSVRALGEAVIRRLTTARGTLADDPDYGIDLLQHLNRGTTRRELQDLGSEITLELQKDDRLDDITVDVTQPSQNVLDFRVRLTPADARLHPFTLTFAIVNGQLAVESMGAT